MSAAQGHLQHIYEDFDLKLSQVYELFWLASGWEPVNLVVEKIDGINMLFKHNGDELVFARSLTDIRSGGLQLEAVKTRFKDEPEVGETVHSAMAALSYIFTHAVINTKPYQDKWMSCDVVSKKHTNVVPYESEAIVIHPLYVLDDGSVEIFEMLDSPVREEHLNPGLKEKWSFKHHKIIPFTGESGDWTVHSHKRFQYPTAPADVLQPAFNKLKALPTLLGMAEEDPTLREVYRHQLKIAAFYSEIPERLIDQTVARILRDPGYLTLTQIKKLVRYDSEYKDIQKFVQNERELLKAAWAPVENIVNSYAFDFLKGSSSFLIADMIGAAACIRDRVERTSERLYLTERHAFVEAQMNRLGKLENINNALEGVVIYYEKKKSFYKLTGWFAPVNQLLGVERYNR